MSTFVAPSVQRIGSAGRWLVEAFDGPALLRDLASDEAWTSIAETETRAQARIVLARARAAKPARHYRSTRKPAPTR